MATYIDRALATNDSDTKTIHKIEKFEEFVDYVNEHKEDLRVIKHLSIQFYRQEEIDLNILEKLNLKTLELINVKSFYDVKLPPNLDRLNLVNYTQKEDLDIHLEKLKTLTIINSKINSIICPLVEYLSIKDTDFIPTGDTLVLSKYITIIDIQRVKVADWVNTTDFKTYKNLKHLNLSDCGIDNFTNLSFDGLKFKELMLTR